MLEHANSQDYIIPAPSKEYFKDAHTMALVSFFPRSGSSLLGYLLTAHRNMIVVNEPVKKEENLYDIPALALLSYILYMDKMRFNEAEKVESVGESKKSPLSDSPIKRIYNQKERYISIPNQWQARCESLQVVGVKNSLPLAEALLEEGMLEKLKENLKESKIRRLKFIFTVRNPYDMIATDTMYWARNERLRKVTKDDVDKMLDYKVRISFPEMCEKGAKVFELMKPQNIFINKHEDIVRSPSKQLTKLCKFLKVPAHSDYLDDCASVIRKKLSKSRYEIEWSEEQKEEVKKIIDKYDFFSKYSWKS